jgi:hypothetical protein
LNIIKDILESGKGNEMFPNKDCKVLIDNDYIMASLGVLSKEYPEDAVKLLANSLKLEENNIKIEKEVC